MKQLARAANGKHVLTGKYNGEIIMRKLRTYPYLWEVVALLGTLLVYLWQGTNIWAEIVVEYLRYAQGLEVTESYGGYLTVFPILAGYVYHFLLSWSPISWYTFSSVLSCLYALLCVYAILVVFRRKKAAKPQILFFFLAMLALLVHPSVNSLINITHLGYIPAILYILWSILDHTLIEDMEKLPSITLPPLILAALSKPSFFCAAFLLVALLTKLHYKKWVWLIFLGVSGLSIYQLLLFGSGAAGLHFGGIGGLVKGFLTFIGAVGGALLFTFTYFFEGAVPNTVVAAAVILGIFMVGSLLVFWWPHRRSPAMWIGGIVLCAIMAACVMPYMILDYSQPLQTVFMQCMSLCFTKHKLQYQFLSSMILALLFAYIVGRYCSHPKTEGAVKHGVYTVMMLAMLNGIFSGIYSAHWQMVQVVGGDTLQYTNEQVFLYPPYPDWDWSWTHTVDGWVRGNTYKNYLWKPESLGASFREKNPGPLPTVENPDAKIFLMLSDPMTGVKNPTNYWDVFNRPDGPRDYRIGALQVSFSEATYYAIRYAVIEYSAETAQMLYDQAYTIAQADREDTPEMDASFLNFIIVW